MDYQIKSVNKIKGISLIEVLMVLAIFAIMFAVSGSVYTDYRASSNLKITTDSVVESLRYAQSSAQSGKGDSVWGVKFFNNQAIIFKGIYETRDTSFDQIVAFPNGISVSGITEIIFNKVVGTTANAGDIFLSNSSGEKKISVNYFGNIDYIDISSPVGQSCMGTIWGDVANNYSNTAYLASSVSYPSICLSENRVCSNGALSGTYMNTSCVVTNYPMSKWSFEEGSGCTVSDLYGGNNGLLKNNCPTISPAWVIGKIGNALNFNGSNNNILVNDSVNLNFTTSMSVSAWIKWNINPSTGLAYATIVNKNGDNQYRLQHNGTNSKFEFGIRTNTGGGYATSTTTPIVGVWYHLVGTWDGSFVKIYVNGILEQTVGRTGVISASTSPLKIGSSSLDARWFNGIIDEVILWDRALNQQEVNEIFSSNL